MIRKSFSKKIIKEAKKLRKKIIFPESEDIRVLKAVSKLERKKIVKPILIGNPEIIKEKAEQNNIKLKETEIIFPDESPSLKEHEETLFELLKLKGITRRQAKALILNPLIYGAILVRKGFADGIVSGATHPTKETILAGIRIIGVKEGIKTASSTFFMEKKGKTMMFSDCGFNINPNEEQLAEIAIETSKTAEQFGIKPRVAMLSFSTKGSSEHELAKKIARATRIVKEKKPEIIIDGEMQLDAAIIPEVRKRKTKNSSLGEEPANILIFPDLNSGNIGYKIAERMGGYKAYGPILQGFKKPINDLSRGCSEEDIIIVAAITALQAVK